MLTLVTGNPLARSGAATLAVLLFATTATAQFPQAPFGDQPAAGDQPFNGSNVRPPDGRPRDARSKSCGPRSGRPGDARPPRCPAAAAGRPTPRPSRRPGRPMLPRNWRPPAASKMKRAKAMTHRPSRSHRAAAHGRLHRFHLVAAGGPAGGRLDARDRRPAGADRLHVRRTAPGPRGVRSWRSLNKPPTRGSIRGASSASRSRTWTTRR